MEAMTEGSPRELRLALRRLAAARIADQAARLKVAEARERYELENATILAEAAAASEALKAADVGARTAALDEFQRTGDVKPDVGVQIKMFKTALYDRAVALEWARTAGTAIKLDEKAFEKIALSGALPLNLVQITSTPNASICVDLSEKLAADEAPVEQAEAPLGTFTPVEGKPGWVKGSAEDFLGVDLGEGAE
jgi:hypothetical protein